MIEYILALNYSHPMNLLKFNIVEKLVSSINILIRFFPLARITPSFVFNAKIVSPLLAAVIVLLTCSK